MSAESHAEFHQYRDSLRIRSPYHTEIWRRIQGDASGGPRWECLLVFACPHMTYALFDLCTIAHRAMLNEISTCGAHQYLQQLCVRKIIASASAEHHWMKQTTKKIQGDLVTHTQWEGSQVNWTMHKSSAHDTARGAGTCFLKSKDSHALRQTCLI